MSKKANQHGRRKGSDKRKNTFKKYGKNTQRGLRIKEAELAKKAEKRIQQAQIINNKKNKNKTKKNNKAKK
tara:strand:+ start:69 stop:281 length:213 start_codon:yes stop_codon:yes gene_type:complete